MINCNGSILEQYSDIQSDLIAQLHTQFSITEILRFEKNSLLFWEQHYFRIISCLRRHRFEIPLNFTMDFLAQQIHLLMEVSALDIEAALIRFQFVHYKGEIAFIVSYSAKPLLQFQSKTKPYTLDLFKEDGIAANSLSNMSSTNVTLLTIAKSYARENGLDDCVLLNNQKNVVETLGGSLYLFQENKLLTPALDSGCQDFVMRTAFNEWIRKTNNPQIELIEQHINPFELQKSDELMVVSIENGGQSVSNYRKTTYKVGRAQALFENFLRELH